MPNLKLIHFGPSKEPVYKRTKVVEPMPDRVRIIDDEKEQVKKNNETMGGLAENVKLQERIADEKVLLDKVFGPGAAGYNSVPPPEYYTNEEWEEAHRNNIEENLQQAELDTVEDELASQRIGQVEVDGEAENDIDEVD